MLHDGRVNCVNVRGDYTDEKNVLSFIKLTPDLKAMNLLITLYSKKQNRVLIFNSGLCVVSWLDLFSVI